MPLFKKKSMKNFPVEEDSLPYEPEVRITKGMYGRLVWRRLLQFVGFGALALIVLYVCFAATWVRVVPTLSGAGFVPVKNVTYEAGVLPEGAQVLVHRTEAQGTQIHHRLKQAFVPSSYAAEVEVVAGPYGEMKWSKPDVLTVDGKPIGAAFPANSDGKSPIDPEDPYLKNQYVAICISGACTEGEAILFDRDQVYGSLLTKSSINGEEE